VVVEHVVERGMGKPRAGSNHLSDLPLLVSREQLAKLGRAVGRDQDPAKQLHCLEGEQHLVFQECVLSFVLHLLPLLLLPLDSQIVCLFGEDEHEGLATLVEDVFHLHDHFLGCATVIFRIKVLIVAQNVHPKLKFQILLLFESVGSDIFFD